MLRANETLYHRSLPQKSDCFVANPIVLRFPGEIFFMKNSKTNRLGSLTFSRSYRVLILLIFASTALAQTKTLAVPTNSEQRTELGLQAAKRNLLQLRHFLLGMPKGADLHNHLSGAVYAESWIRAAAEDRLCVDLRNLAFSKPQSSSDSGSGHTTFQARPIFSRTQMK